MNVGIYARILVLAGLITLALNGQVLHFDEEFFIGIFACIFFFTLYRLMRLTLSSMFFQHCDIIYVTLSYVMHTILMTLQVCKQLLSWTTLKLHAHELWTLLSYHRFTRVVTVGGGNITGVIAALVTSSNKGVKL